MITLTDYGFEYSDEEQDEEAVDIENCYYNAKGEWVIAMHILWTHLPCNYFISRPQGQ